MRVKILMKSGNVINLRAVKELDIKYNSTQINHLELKFHWYNVLLQKLGMITMLFVQSIDLSQIEAITYK